MRRAALSLLSRPRWLVGLVVAAVVLLGGVFIGGGLVVRAVHDFPDVPDAAFFHDDATWLKDRAITLGCGGGNYCPNDNVTRGQMASFLKREGEALTPTFIDVTVPAPGGAGALDLDAGLGPVICPTTTAHVPPYEQQAVMMANGSIFASGAASFVDLGVQGVYSTDGGTTWLPFSPAVSVGQESAGPGVETALSYAGHADLTPGTPYDFGVRLFAWSGSTGDATADTTNSFCQMTVEILNRNP